MKYFRLTILLLFLTFVALPLSAQESVDLSERFEDPNLPVQFNYPADWDVSGDRFEIYLEPDPEVYPDIADVYMSFYDYTPESQEELGVNMEMSAEEGMETLIAFAIEQGVETDFGDITVATYGDNTVATIEIEPDEAVIASFVESGEGLMVFDVVAPTEQIELAREIYFAILPTIEFIVDDLADTELPETYTDETGFLTFSYPDDWVLRPFDPISISRVFPSGVVDISFQFLTDEVEEMFDIAEFMTPLEIAEAFVDGLQADGIDITEDDIVLERYGEVLTASIDTTDGEDYIIVTVVEANERLVLVRLIGNEDDVNTVRGLYFAILASITLEADESDLGNFGELDTFTSNSNRFELLYPAGWLVSEEPLGLEIVPETSEDAIIRFIVDPDIIEAELGISADNEPNKLAEIIESQAVVDDITKEKFLLGDHISVELILVEEDGYTTILHVVETENGLYLAALSGDGNVIRDLRSTFYGMLIESDFIAK